MGHSVDALIKLDYSLNVLSAKPIEKIVEANCISIRNGFIAIAGEDRTNDFVTRTLVKVCDTSGIFDSSKYDMGVINLISTSIKLDKSSGVAKIYFDAVIKNFGNKIVDSVTVYTGGAMEYDCGDFNASQTFHGLALAPGDTARVTLGYIYCEYFSNTKYYYLCAYTCSPNEEADQNYNNDSKCDTVLITSLDDVIGNYPAIIIYPNPAHDILKIGCSQTLQCSYSIINAIGQFFQNGRMILSEESEISIEKLPRGMYFLKINMGYKSETVKFIKE